MSHGVPLMRGPNGLPHPQIDNIVVTWLGTRHESAVMGLAAVRCELNLLHLRDLCGRNQRANGQGLNLGLAHLAGDR